MAVVEILTCRFCRSDFESEVRRGRKPTVCSNCREIGLKSNFAAGNRKTADIRSANPEVDAGVLYRHGKPIFAEDLSRYNAALLAKPAAQLGKELADIFLASVA